MNNLSVYMNGVIVGVLSQDSGGMLSFGYRQEWIDNPSAMPLSYSLPICEKKFNDRICRPFFAGILPEAAPRKLISEILGISYGNDFALLNKIGGECAGAVSLLPEGVSADFFQTPEYRHLDNAELEMTVNELSSRPLMAGKKGMRLSLAGAQDKLPVFLDGEEICMPLGSSPSSHILKPEPERFPGLSVNELFCMTLAKKTGINVPDTELRRIGGKDTVLVQRYDRKRDNASNLTRLHQEDFCQALGFLPNQKYQEEGGPGIRDSVELLRNCSSAPVIDITEFFNAVIFNILIGNADAHGKNFSLLYTGKSRRLAPFYDLVSTVMYENLSKTPAMKIGRDKSINAFTAGNWKKMADNVSVSWPLLKEKIKILCKNTAEHLDEVYSIAADYDMTVAEQLRSTIRSRIDKLQKMCTDHRNN